MNSSNTSTNALSNASNVAMPHAKVEGTLQRVAYRNYDNVGPAASINTSAIDLAQYIRLHLNGGRLDGQILIDDKALAELNTAQMVVPITPHPAAELKALTPKFSAYGLGWFLRDYRGRKVVFHTGGVDGMAAIAAFVPEAQLGLVVLTNQSSGPLMLAICFHILDTFFGDHQMDWFAAFSAAFQTFQEGQHLAEEEVVQARVKGTAPSLPLEGYAGTYHDMLYGGATVALEDEHLVLRFEHSSCFTGDLAHWHYDTFRIHWRDPVIPKGLVTFPLNSRAEIAEMRFDQPRLLDVDFAELNFERLVEDGIDSG